MRGIPFQIYGAAEEKARHPNSVLVLGAFGPRSMDKELARGTKHARGWVAGRILGWAGRWADARNSTVSRRDDIVANITFYDFCCFRCVSHCI